MSFTLAWILLNLYHIMEDVVRIRLFVWRIGRLALAMPFVRVGLGLG